MCAIEKDDLAGTRTPAERQLLRQLGATIRRLRRERGLTQEAFASAAGMHRTYVTECELGRRNLALTTLGRMTATLNISMGEFFTEVHRSYPQNATRPRSSAKAPRQSTKRKQNQITSSIWARVQAVLQRPI